MYAVNCSDQIMNEITIRSRASTDFYSYSMYGHLFQLSWI